MNYTKGEWKVTNELLIWSDQHEGLQFHNRIALMEDGYEAEDNAQLIVAAVNACASVNPDNPLAVAESIKDMYAALKLAREALTIKLNMPTYREILEFKNKTEPMILSALAKAKSK